MPVHRSVFDALPHLTVQDRKAEAYACDFVQEPAWDCITRVWEGRVSELLLQHSLLILKPETLARRLGLRALEFVVEHGFVPVAWSRVSIDRNAANLIWRYQWNAATSDRVRLTSLVNSMGPSILLVLRDCNSGAVPASVKLWRLKGSAHATRRTSEHLRTHLGMHNRMLGFVHAPDEPADVVRDLGILFDHEAMVSLLSQALRPEPDALASAMGAINQSISVVPRHDLLPSGVIDKVGALETKFGDLTALVQSMKDGATVSLDHVLNVCAAAGPSLCEWDAYVLAAELIQHDKHGVSPILDARAVGEVEKRWQAAGAAAKAALDKSGAHVDA